MAVQINVNPDAPGFPQTVIPGQSVDVPSGSIVQFVDTETGQVIDPQTLGVTILPDGTLRVVFSDGTTLDLVGASPESLEPAAGPPPTGGGDAVGQGSSLAVALFFDDGFGNLFEAGQGGGFESLAGVGFLPPGADPNLLLLLAGGGPELLAVVVAGVEDLLFDPDANIANFDLGVPLFNGDGTLNTGFDDATGSTGIPIDLNITHAREGDDVVNLDDTGGVNNLHDLFGAHTVFYGGADDDELNGGTDDDTVAGDGLFLGLQSPIPPDGFPDDSDKDHDGPVTGGTLIGDNDILTGGDEAGGNDGFEDDEGPAGIFNDVLGGDVLVASPGVGSGQIGFPNPVPIPVGGPGALPDVPTPGLDERLNLAFFGQASVPIFDAPDTSTSIWLLLEGGQDSIFGNDGNDFAFGDGLIAFTPPVKALQDDSLFFDVEMKGGADLVNGDAGDDWLFGDFILTLPFDLSEIENGVELEAFQSDDIGFLPFGPGFDETELIGGDDELNGGAGVDLALGDAIFGIFGDGLPNGAPSVAKVLQDLDGAPPETALDALFSNFILGGADTINGGDEEDLLLGDGLLALDFSDPFDEGGDNGEILFATSLQRQLEADLSEVFVEKAVVGGNDTINGDAAEDILIGDGILGVSDTFGAFIPRSSYLGGFGLGSDLLLLGGDDLLTGGGSGDVLIGDGIVGATSGSGVFLAGLDGLLFDEQTWTDGVPGAGALANNGLFSGPIIIGGNDVLRGGDGGDLLRGDGLEQLNGGVAIGGDDLLFGDAGSDSLFGDGGNDVLFGDVNANETLFGPGGPLNDLLDADRGLVTSPDPGNGGNDTLDGGEGNDILDGHSGNDTVIGNEGSDQGIFDASLADPSNDEFYDGNNGVGTRQLGADSPGGDRDTLLLVFTAEQLNDPALVAELAAYQGTDDVTDFTFTTLGLTVVEWEDVHIFLQNCGDLTLDLDNALFGDDGADELEGDSNDNLIAGLGGGDVLSGDGDGSGTFGNDLLLGHGGEDTLLGDDTGDLSDATGGNDKLFGGEENDLLVGDTGAEGDILDGGQGGDDSLFGGGGNDRLFGDAGDDMEDSSAGGADLLDGGTGDDTLSGDGGGGGDPDLEGSQGGNDTLLGGDGNDTLFGETAGDVEDSDDSLTSSQGGDDTLFGGGDDDLLVGDAGDDLEGGSSGGQDLLDGGAGNDTLIGDAVEDILDTSTGGNDTLFGGAGNDTLFGDAAGDVAGTGGDDTLDGNAGADTVFGGAGSDIGIFDAGEEKTGRSLYDGNKGDTDPNGDGDGDASDVEPDLDFDTLLLGFTEEQLSNSDLVSELFAFQSFASSGDIDLFEFEEIPLDAIEWEDVDFFLHGCEDLILEEIHPTFGGLSLSGDHAANDLIISSEIGSIIAGETALFVPFEFSDDALLGMGGNDTVVGDAVGFGVLEASLGDGQTGGDDKLFGGEDDDLLIGDVSGSISDSAQGGNDTLFGGAGDDTLFGDAAGDVAGTGGNDTLTGDAGNDTFVITAVNNGDDLITDLTDDDTLRITDVLDADGGGVGVTDLDAAATITDNGTDVTVTFNDGSGSAVIAGIGTGLIDTAAELSAAIDLEITA